jgi:dipeptidyl aminopeptidase/acylaminoacyl peptidase
MYDMRRATRLAVAVLIGLGLGLPCLSVFVTEGALHIWQHPAPPPAIATALSRQTGASWETVRVAASDGVVLDGWLFTPRQPNGAAVIALHGVADTRIGMMSHAAFLVRAGYTVLTPDCRGHGSSGGDIVTYGIREADDVHRWADLLFRRPGVYRLYGIGQSMGASILLESLPREPRFRALVADCPFATFEEVAYDRLEQRGMLGTAVSWPLVQIGFLYTRLRYGLNLRDASPAAAVRATKVPVLLIHGMKDANIPPRHSRQLHALNPAMTQLWEVPGADHVASLGTAPQQYQHIVIAWFEQ